MSSIAALAALLVASGPAGAVGEAQAAGPSELPHPRSVHSPPSSSRLELVESWPIETAMEHPDIPDAADVWREIIDSAARSLDLAEFYASDTTGSALTPIVEALEAAAARGVKIRVLAEKKFHRTYPRTLDRLAACRGIEVRLYDVAALMGGVLHAKYMIRDGVEVYVGSQNFDWRALEHIQELGVRVSIPEIADAFARVFEADWELAAGGDPSSVLAPEVDAARSDHSGDPNRPLDLERNPGQANRSAGQHEKRSNRSDVGGDVSSPALVVVAGDTIRVAPVFSPRDWLPRGLAWDLPEIVQLIDGARETVRVQLLTYGTTDRQGRYFGDLEDALRRAAARGVQVQMLLSSWCQRAGTIEGLQSLEPLPNVDVRLVTIPEWSGGFIPYARVIHAKYLVVDGRSAWIGTSNWERDYFHASRNAGLILRSRGIGARLDRYFLDGWNGPYARPVDPCGAYVAPRIGK